MSISKLVLTGIALVVLAGGVSQAVAAPHHAKKLHFSVKGVAGSEAGEANEADENEGAEHEGAEDNN
jgi:hypothetical protein